MIESDLVRRVKGTVSWHAGALVLLVVAVGISPRIPLPIFIPRRRFDLRAEDLILVILLFFWLIGPLQRLRLYLTPLFLPLAAYCVLMIAATALGAMTATVDPSRGLVYGLKQFEYFSIFLLVANWVRTAEELKVVVAGIIGAGLANLGWFAEQVITGTRSPLLFIRGDYLPAGFWQPPNRLEPGYGPSLIGEPNVQSGGGFFLLVSLLALAFLLFSHKRRQRRVFTLLSVGFSLCTFLTVSRDSALGLMVGLAVLLITWGRSVRTLQVMVLGLLLIGGIWVLEVIHPFAHDPFERWEIGYTEGSLGNRIRRIWDPMLRAEADPLRFVAGFGTGSLGFARELSWEQDNGYSGEEAHNHYLRVLFETGIFGLAAFIWLLTAIIRWGARILKDSRLLISRIVGGAAMAGCAGLCVGALFSDIFINVVINELWWILIGLAMAAYRIERGLKVNAAAVLRRQNLRGSAGHSPFPPEGFGTATSNINVSEV